MKKVLLLLLLPLAVNSYAQQEAELISFEDYETVMAMAKEHRKKRLLTLDEFVEKAKDSSVIILDVRSDSMYKMAHLKGAKHLNFSDFNQEVLDHFFASKDVTILIYCNNNFKYAPRQFMTKGLTQVEWDEHRNWGHFNIPETMALTIPTYINLYGYGYRNVYELGETVSVFDQRIQFEGSDLRFGSPGQ